MKVGCLTARDTVEASPVDTRARRAVIMVSSFRFQAPTDRDAPGQRTDSRSDSDFGFRFQVSSPDRSGRTRTLPRPLTPSPQAGRGSLPAYIGQQGAVPDLSG